MKNSLRKSRLRKVQPVQIEYIECPKDYIKIFCINEYFTTKSNMIKIQKESYFVPMHFNDDEIQIAVRKEYLALYHERFPKVAQRRHNMKGGMDWEYVINNKGYLRHQMKTDMLQDFMKEREIANKEYNKSIPKDLTVMKVSRIVKNNNFILKGNEWVRKNAS